MQQEIRALVTKHCNYKCGFCHEEGLSQRPEALFTPENYGYLASIARQLGSRTMTLTGGEPLFRRDIVDITKSIGGETLQTITTNGYLLKERAAIGENISRLNVSIHSMDPSVYKGVTTVNGLSKVKSNLQDFKQKYPQVEIAINSTLVNGINASSQSIEDFSSFAQQIGANIKFIELFPQGSNGFIYNEESSKQLEALGFQKEQETPRKINLSRDGLKVSLTRILCSQARLEDNPGEYCSRNNDIFLSPDGLLQSCRECIPDINITSEVKGQMGEALKEKIERSFSNLGKNCIY